MRNNSFLLFENSAGGVIRELGAPLARFPYMAGAMGWHLPSYQPNRGVTGVAGSEAGLT